MPMNPLETAILRTVLYADVFNFPMSADEIHHFLIYDHPVSRHEIGNALTSSIYLRDHLEEDQGFIVRVGRKALITQRARSEKISETLWPQALHYAAWLARLPFVRMVAVTGALAMRNPIDENDDLDYMIVTTARRVWLARAFSILLVRLVRLRGIVICPNYVLAENVLEQNRTDLFIAHEVTQMIPIYGHDLYRNFRTANPWVTRHLPNANAPFYTETEYHVRGLWRFLKQGLEILLDGWLGNQIERWEYRRKVRHFAPQMTGNHGAELDESRVKGHFNDYSHPVLRQYHERLRDHGLDHLRVTAPGD